MTAPVDLPMAKAHLSIEGTAYDAVIPGYIAGAIKAIGNLCGPLEPETITRRIDGNFDAAYAGSYGGRYSGAYGGGSDELALPIAPAIELISLTPVGSVPYDVSQLYLDPDSAVVSFNDGRCGGFRARKYDAVWSAGYETCPDDLVLAVLELIRDLWSAQKRAKGRPGTGSMNRTANTVPGTSAEMPFEVQKLIAPYQRQAI